MAPVGLQAVLQARLILATALVEDPVAADDPALDLIEPQLAANSTGLPALNLIFGHNFFQT